VDDQIIHNVKKMADETKSVPPVPPVSPTKPEGEEEIK